MEFEQNIVFDDIRICQKKSIDNSPCQKRDFVINSLF